MKFYIKNFFSKCDQTGELHENQENLRGVFRNESNIYD